MSRAAVIARETVVVKVPACNDTFYVHQNVREEFVQELVQARCGNEEYTTEHLEIIEEEEQTETELNVEP
jgi:hypothetical protein